MTVRQILKTSRYTYLAVVQLFENATVDDPHFFITLSIIQHTRRHEITMSKVFTLVNLTRCSRQHYRDLTHEAYRVDYKTIAKIPSSSLENVRKWEQNVKIHNTKHWMEQRLRQYVGKPSRQKDYVEIYPCEYEWLSKAKLENQIPNSQCVEIGWNKDGDICKIAYVLPLHKVCPEIYPTTTTISISISTRFFFYCIGVDGGLKTAYVLDSLKIVLVTVVMYPMRRQSF